MNSKPNKPEHYVRDYLIIFAIGLLFFVIGIYFEFKYAGAIFIFSLTFLPLIRFRAYHAEVRAYNQSKIESSSQVPNNNVNENIARYIEAQRIRRENAKWWQFWL